MNAARLLKPDDIRERLGCSRSYAYEIARSLPHIVTGRLLRVRPEVFEAWLARREQPGTAPECLPAAPAAPRRAPRDRSAIAANENARPRLRPTQPRTRNVRPSRS